ncbi:hypothetical protein ANANG_G00269610 [Anguilla anguilla]|uniref:Transmembrane protein TMEM132 cohesin-like domain-containing protein n=1 Tax=Anguilla anguilla TaxID=7936 RepID=A0A9D3RM18_ANGAN|nr:hypothetical protein ANANG_G00269610 [Anguilla anguilla]
MRRIGSVRLHQSSTDAQLGQVRLDANFVVLMPSGPVRQRDGVTAYVATSDPSQVDRFTLRVTLKRGVEFLGARPSAPFLWSVTQDERREGQKVITLQCSRSDRGSTAEQLAAAAVFPLQSLRLRSALKAQLLQTDRSCRAARALK